MAELPFLISARLVRRNQQLRRFLHINISLFNVELGDRDKKASSKVSCNILAEALRPNNGVSGAGEQTI